jgi:hypothetical protein
MRPDVHGMMEKPRVMINSCRSTSSTASRDCNMSAWMARPCSSSRTVLDSLCAPDVQCTFAVSHVLSCTRWHRISSQSANAISLLSCQRLSCSTHSSASCRKVEYCFQVWDATCNHCVATHTIEVPATDTEVPSCQGATAQQCSNGVSVLCVGASDGTAYIHSLKNGSLEQVRCML